MAGRARSGADGGAETVAVVLSGAAARGAFQAGALAELIPALERDGLRPTVWLGTSAGSINAVLWGAAAHLGAEEAAKQVLGVWQQISAEDVYRPLLPFSLAEPDCSTPPARYSVSVRGRRACSTRPRCDGRRPTSCGPGSSRPTSRTGC